MQSLPLTQGELSQGTIRICTLYDLLSPQIYIQSVGFLFCYLDHLDISVAETDKESVTQSVPVD